MEGNSAKGRVDHHREWLLKLPPGVAEMLEATGDTHSDFAGHVKMAQALAKITFQRAVEAAVSAEPIVEPNPWAQGNDEGKDKKGQDDEVANARLTLAIRANESATRLMEQRLALQDKYKLVERTPLPMAIRLNVVKVAKAEGERRLAMARGSERAPVPLEEHTVEMATE